MLWTLLKSALLMPLRHGVWSNDHLELLDPSSRYIGLLSSLRAFTEISHLQLALALVALQVISWTLTHVVNRAVNLAASVAFSAASLLFFDSIAPTLDGGDNLASIILFVLPLYFMARLISRRPAKIGPSPSSALSATLVTVIRFQIVAMYAYAGTCKLLGHEWQNGTALFYILQSDLYSFPPAQALVLRYPLVTVAATYATIIFQVTFPLLIWVRKARPYLIGAGVALHLSIIIGMGLFEFGLIMMISYLIWIRDKDLNTVVQGIRRQLNRLRTVLHKRRVSQQQVGSKL